MDMNERKSLKTFAKKIISRNPNLVLNIEKNSETYSIHDIKTK